MIFLAKNDIKNQKEMIRQPAIFLSFYRVGGRLFKKHADAQRVFFMGNTLVVRVVECLAAQLAVFRE